MKNLDNEQRPGLRGGERLAIALAVVGGVLGAGMFLPASAQATGAAAQIEAAYESLTTDLTSVYVPAMIAIVLIGVGVALGLRWLRKGSSKA